MNSVQLLDCTLRDGGYVNDWNFGKVTIDNVLRSLINSGIDIVECGFVSQKKETTDEKSVYANTNFYIPESDGNVKFAAMINYGEFDPKDLLPKAESRVDIIRVAFHKADFENAVKYCDEISKKGYIVFLQPMNAMDYSEEEYMSLIKLANGSAISVFYLVDTFGNMRKSDLIRLYSLIDSNLRKDIPIGFHSHNNLQLSFSNAQELIARHGDRDILIDSSIFGMGRGAGNLCTELMTQYLNENLGARYNLLPILECIDDSIMPIYLNHSWGYSVPYYLAAINSCHPNYANYLVSMQTLCVRDINLIIKSIPVNKKAKFDKDLIKRLYLEYLDRQVDDTNTLEHIRKLCEGRDVLLLAPGNSILNERHAIQKYILEKKTVIISINHLPNALYNVDGVFISNLKRFKDVDPMLDSIEDFVYYTSNITTQKKNVLNYSNYLADNDVIFDNAGILIINILKKVGVKHIALAGYDGFNYVGNRNYYDNKYVRNVSFEKQVAINNAMRDYLSKLKKDLDIEFVTKTVYN